jgi:MFS transporter, putative metabolite:H+ symporter
MDTLAEAAAKPSDPRQQGLLSLSVVVAALGYFVDIYDLVLFSIVRVASLRAIGFSGTALVDYGTLLLNVQMAGMLIGGVIWGVLGDRRGRVSILFGSILLYSIANLANAFANSLETFIVLRFVAGIGLAGELGAGITLVAESLPIARRGQSAAIVAGFGVLGAVFANLISEQFDWRTAYLIGGILGLMLLVLRFGALESGLFKRLKTQAETIKRGDFLSLFTNRDRFRRYLCCILVGLPLWYVVGILLSFAPELARLLGVTSEVTAGRAVMFCYLGFAAGDFASGFISQQLRTRKKVIAGFLAGLTVTVALYFTLRGVPPSVFYTVCFALGATGGYWAVLLIMSAEQFGTNLRATAATTVPNFIRGALIPVSAMFQLFKPALGLIGSAALTGAVTLALAFLALRQLSETSERQLDFLEE